jgi:hypothetical protein
MRKPKEKARKKATPKEKSDQLLVIVQKIWKN